jgi:hypothetical protein
MAEIPASKIIYTYTDPIPNQSNKQGMQIISVKSHKEITITYNSQIQDFERVLPTVNKMINTFIIGLDQNNAN